MRRTGQWRLLAGLVIAVCSSTPASWCVAYSVSSGLTESCHERITLRAGEALVREMPVPPGFTPPEGVWSDLAEMLLGEMSGDPQALSEHHRFMLVSLIVGVRAPDTDGHSVMNLENLHRLHGDPSAKGQYAHCLRGPDDDGAGGDAAAIVGTRQVIIELIEEGVRRYGLLMADQLINAVVYLDFYGRIELKIWAPFFFVGRALHALQDSFSHALRSDADGLRQVVHVMNYIDAIASDFNHQRDGLAHSDTLDDCSDPRAKALFEAAIEASAELLAGVLDQLEGEAPGATVQVLDDWLILKVGCTPGNDFCGNRRWVELAEEEQTGPYLSSLLGCAMGSSSGVGRSVLGLLVDKLF